MKNYKIKKICEIITKKKRKKKKRAKINIYDEFRDFLLCFLIIHYFSVSAKINRVIYDGNYNVIAIKNKITKSEKARKENCVWCYL